MRCRVPLLTVTAALVSCGPSEPATPVALSVCPDSVMVTITAGTTPQISWTPACRLSEIQVADSVNASFVWLVGRHASPADNLIVPPVTYGVPPTGVGVGYGPTPLVAGHTYILGLWKFDSTSTYWHQVAGRFFTP